MPGNKQIQTPTECPVCGADVPPKSRACPECGADERSGWNTEGTRYDGLDLPGSAFVDETTPGDDAAKQRPVRNGIPLFWWWVGAGLTAALIYLVLGVGF
jgi:hypothetical protein